MALWHSQEYVNAADEEEQDKLFFKWVTCTFFNWSMCICNRLPSLVTALHFFFNSMADVMCHVAGLCTGSKNL